ncbi:c-type cytochrome [Flavitalea sp.]|nr:c-type cytochrome [Flavitalea sp.]
MQLRSSKTFRQAGALILILAGISAAKIMVNLSRSNSKGPNSNIGTTIAPGSKMWEPPDTNQIPFSAEGNLIRYGRDLVANTSLYLGPKGKVAAVTNGMNCQNCHLDAGTRLWGNNFSAVSSTYPQFRGRSGTVESVYKRVNDCLERSLNGKTLDTNSHEMQAFAAYINWVGHNVAKNVKPEGAGVKTIPFLGRPADPENGLIVYKLKCQRCHGADGLGSLNSDSTAYFYPPLWGKNSYNTGAGLFRLSHFAGYIRYNMPFDAQVNVALLTDQEAWDVAAFVNTQSRPQKKFIADWPDISWKPFDYPFGPYADSFSEHQHKFGSFGPIWQENEKMKSKKLKAY